MEFEWDNRKGEENARKHDVTFQEAASIFGDPLAITFADPDHSTNEERYITFGQSLKQRLIMVSHTQRGGRTRIISARPVGSRERRIYEDG
jgi:uncharacterized DUF497 family protein